MENVPQVLEESLNVLAEKLAVPAAQLLDVGVKGVQIEGVLNLLIALSFILTSIIGSVFVYKKWELIYESDWETAVGGVCVVFSIIAIVIIPCYLYEGAIQLLTPKYWILKHFIF